MGREVRRVPKDWQHPRDAAGRLRPLLAADFAVIAAAWDAGAARWARGMVATHCSLPGFPAWRPRDQHVRGRDYIEHAGERPRADAFMPAWPVELRTSWQMYENVTAGTPISPVCASPEALAFWLADRNAFAGPSITASYDEWLSMIRSTGKSGLFVMESGLPTSTLQLPPTPGYARFFSRIRRTPACD